MKKNTSKIAIDTSPLYDGNSTRGVGFYTKNLVENLNIEITTNPDYEDISITLIEKPQDLHPENYDLIHYPFFDPFYRTLHPSLTPFVLTVHDLIPLELPKMFPVGIKGKINWFFQKNNLLKAQNIITVSHYSKYSIHKLTKYPIDKIYVTHEAAGNQVKRITDKKILNNIIKKYHLPEKFILFVGDANLNKNLPTLAKSCLKLNIPLVLAGSSLVKTTLDHPWTKDILYIQKLARLHPELIQLKGFVPDSDISAFYSLALAYCQPSYLEGFGLPVIEAMMAKCPVIYANNSSIPEIIYHQGYPFDPYNQNQLTNLISHLQNNFPDPELIENAYQRTKLFTWKNTALSTLAVYRSTLLNAQK